MTHTMHTTRDRFKFKGSTLWTDTTGITWLRDHWGYLLPVPCVRQQDTEVAWSNAMGAWVSVRRKS